MMKNTSSWSSFSSQDIKIFFFFFLVMLKKRLDYKDNFNFNIYDVTTWLTYNYNSHIAQYLKK